MKFCFSFPASQFPTPSMGFCPIGPQADCFSGLWLKSAVCVHALIACWGQGPIVLPSFDRPLATRIFCQIFTIYTIMYLSWAFHLKTSSFVTLDSFWALLLTCLVLVCNGACYCIPPSTFHLCNCPTSVKGDCLLVWSSCSVSWHLLFFTFAS